MKALARLAPTVPAILAAAIGISVAVFMLHGAGVQGEPAPLAVIGAAAGRVAVDLPATVNERAREPVVKAASFAQPATTRSVELVSQRRTPATNTHRVRHSAGSGVVRRASSVSRHAAAPVASATPVIAHGHRHARKSTAGALPRAHGDGKAQGHGRAFGHSSEQHHGPPNGGGNGHKGGKK